MLSTITVWDESNKRTKDSKQELLYSLSWSERRVTWGLRTKDRSYFNHCHGLGGESQKDLGLMTGPILATVTV